MCRISATGQRGVRPDLRLFSPSTPCKVNQFIHLPTDERAAQSSLATSVTVMHQYGDESSGMVFIACLLGFFTHPLSFFIWDCCYDRHCSVRLVVCFDLAIDQIAQLGLNSLQMIYYLVKLFSCKVCKFTNYHGYSVRIINYNHSTKIVVIVEQFTKCFSLK